jgi:pimeloyl-ACP methyl ester carboxylesterase
MSKIKIFLLILIGSITGLSILGFTYQTIQEKADHTAYPAPGKFYDVDGIRLHLDCRGQGTPTVMLEAGLTSGSFSWALVHDAISEQTRVCAYDRPGMDWSDPIDRAADATEVSDRLFDLLKAAGIDGPKILLGMSAGGVYVREYYKNHPDEVVGLVFVDSSHEQQGDRLPEFDGSGTYDAMMRACKILQPLGVIRAFGLLDPFVDQYDLTEDIRVALLANMNQSHTCSSMYWEGVSFAGEVKDKEPPISLGDLPVVVLSQGEEPRALPDFGITLDQAVEQRLVWDVLQQELTGLSSNSQRFIATDSGHVIQLDQPELFIEKVTELALQLRN